MEEASNGTGEDTFVTDLRARVTALNMRAEALRMEYEEASNEAKRYEKALNFMTGEARPIGRPAGPGGKKGSKENPSIGEERLADIKRIILGIAREQEEFRQVDIRSISTHSSGTLAQGFEKLRQDGWLRLSRADGNNKYFRLTREGLRELEGAA
jgi:hypothetical protein